MGVGVFCAQKRGWAERENAFFEFFLREVSTAPPPALTIYPRGGDPSPQRTRTACTGLHSIPDRPRGAGAEGVERVRNCADMDTRATHQNRLYFHHFFVYVCCPCNFTNTLKSVIIMSAKTYTKKCKPHITKHQNRRTKNHES